MAAKVEDGPCVAYVGPGGSGHFVKLFITELNMELNKYLQKLMTL